MVKKNNTEFIGQLLITAKIGQNDVLLQFFQNFEKQSPNFEIKSHNYLFIYLIFF